MTDNKLYFSIVSICSCSHLESMIAHICVMFCFMFYLEHREDGCWEGIKVCCWSFIFKVKPKKDSQQHNYKLKKTTTPKPLEQMLKTRFQSGLNGLYLQFRKVTWINGIKKKKAVRNDTCFRTWETWEHKKGQIHTAVTTGSFSWFCFPSATPPPHTHLYFYTCEDIQWSFPDPNNYKG